MAENTQHGFDLNNPNQSDEQNGPVECLGKTFANDAERREHYLALLAEKLKDPEFRKIEGFPIGEDEDILELSDPPYYTACPNPFIEEFIAHYGRPYDSSEGYKREPYVADVSEGKSDPIYTAHSYHTKVPHKAIMRFILHYTDPGDVIADNFCGSGMAGIAAQLCGDKATVESLGYKVFPNGEVLEEVDRNNKKEWVKFSRIGVRYAVLNDLSPAATFIAENYNDGFNLEKHEGECAEILTDLNTEIGWMYLTTHSDGQTKGKINFVIWSDVFSCTECGEEVIYWDAAIDTVNAEVKKEFLCGSCKSVLKKSSAERVQETLYDSKNGTTLRIAKQVPVLINYSIEGVRERQEKVPDQQDLDLIAKASELTDGIWHPSNELPDGYNTRQPIRSHGMKRICDFYTARNLYALSKVFKKLDGLNKKFLFTGFVGGATKLNQFHLKNYVFGGGGVNPGPRKGTLYAPSISMEVPITSLLKDRLRTQMRAFRSAPNRDRSTVCITTGSADSLLVDQDEGVLDYIFIDPPFGANLNYSELSFAWESWLKVFTNNTPEAIENTVQQKGAVEYRKLMTECFREAYRLLKPGRWMTVEFSNTKASVWNNIRASLTDSGFIVGNVSALDKKQGGINSNISSTAVKQDLVISAYKPNGGFTDRFSNENDEDGVWDFIRTHLGYLPIVKKQGGELISVSERDSRILFDEVVAYFVKNLRDVPISSKDFQQGLLERFAERDGQIFLPEQVAEYDKARMTSKHLKQLSIFVDDEASAIEWLRQLLNEKPQSYQDIHPKFINELSGWKKAEDQLELSKLLEQNFLNYDGIEPLPPQIHSYLSTNFKEMRNLSKDDSQLIKKAKDRWYVPNPDREEDLQKLRDRDLLKQFDEYKNHEGRKLKTVRMEAVRCGFKKAWQDRDYSTIMTVAEKIPQNLLQEDQKLLMWYDQAQTRSSDESLF